MSRDDKYKVLLGQLSTAGHRTLYPTLFLANLRFRNQWRQLAELDPSLQRDLWTACNRDILFWVNVFVWTFDPRKPGEKVIPFVTYPYQDPAIVELNEAVEKGEDRAWEKSRDMGATWMGVSVIAWRCIFRPNESHLWISRKEELVDGDSDSLFWKLDFLIDHLPGWMRPPIDRKHMHWVNMANQSRIDGSATTEDAGRGGRRTSVFLDEFAMSRDGYGMLAATRDVSNCRIFNSTPKGGAGNAFYDVTHTLEIKKLSLHWTLHPEKSYGLYRDEQGNPRSPWYDRECKRAATPREIAQELDISYGGSEDKFFNEDRIDMLIEETAQQPLHVGDLMTGDASQGEPSSPIWLEQPGGRLRLWCELDADGRPPSGKSYGVAADISAGSGASNSSLTIVDRDSGIKVGEFASPDLSPHEFADMALAVCQFFASPDEGAFLIWEENGHGSIFGKRVIQRGYYRVYYRRAEKQLAKTLEAGFVPGWYSTGETKLTLLGEYREAIFEHRFINRSLEALTECKDYLYTRNGIKHRLQVMAEDPSGAAENHGDRVIADALAWKICQDSGAGVMSRSQLDEKKTDPPLGSFAHRRLEWESNKRRSDEQESGWT